MLTATQSPIAAGLEVKVTQIVEAPSPGPHPPQAHQEDKRKQGAVQCAQRVHLAQQELEGGSPGRQCREGAGPKHGTRQLSAGATPARDNVPEVVLLQVRHRNLVGSQLLHHALRDGALAGPGGPPDDDERNDCDLVLGRWRCKFDAAVFGRHGFAGCCCWCWPRYTLPSPCSMPCTGICGPRRVWGGSGPSAPRALCPPRPCQVQPSLPPPLPDHGSPWQRRPGPGCL